MTDDEFINAVKLELQGIENSGIQNPGDQFSIWFCERILGEDADDSRDIYHIGGANDHKIDIGIADEDHETVIVAQCKFASDPLNTVYNADVPASVKDAVDRLIQMPSVGNSRRKQFAKAYNEIDDEDKPKRRLAVGFGRFSEDAQKYATQFGIELYDFQKIKDLYEIANQPSDGSAPASLSFSVNLTQDKIERTLKNPTAREIITIVTAGEIYEAVHVHRHKLFEQNFRYKLRQTSKTRIAGDIKKTLRDEPGALLLLNNGLTIICSKVESATNRLILYHPQIVNGCQSSWAIYEALSEMTPYERENTKRAEILAKIVETPDQNLSERIARATNQQNAIGQRDLKANDHNQALIAASFDRFKPRIFFERKDGAYAALKKSSKDAYSVPKGPGPGRPQSRQIDNTLAGQLYLAVLGLPYYSKQNKKLIFESYYSPIFGINNEDRFNFFGELDTLNNLRPGPDAFRDDVIFGFCIQQLVEALAALYVDKLNSYEPVDSLTTLQKQQRDRLIDVSGFLKIWSYFAVACFSSIADLWAHRRKCDVSLIREKLVGNDVNVFFASLKLRKQLFTLEENLDHAFILNEQEPSLTFKNFAQWFISLSEYLNVVVEEYLKTKPTSFRWNAFIDQRADTYKDMRKWWNQRYGMGEKEWSRLFPID